MLALEARLGVRLLTRTTRSVSTTEAGARLLDTVAPRLQEIEAELGQLSAMRDKPAGTVRITAHDHAIGTVLWPALMPLLQAVPGHPGRVQRRLRLHRHRGTALRCRRAGR